MTSRALSPKQQAFVEHYAACGNATEAARRAGYKKPHPQGAENLLKPTIQAALAALTEKTASERIATVIERQELWTSVMRREIQEDPELLKAALKASELLGKAQGDFIQRHDVSVGPAEPDWEALLGSPAP